VGYEAPARREGRDADLAGEARSQPPRRAAPAGRGSLCRGEDLGNVILRLALDSTQRLSWHPAGKPSLIYAKLAFP
jgi:hypothetical protein